MKKILAAIAIGFTLFFGILHAQEEEQDTTKQFQSAKDTLRDQLDYYDPSELELEIEDEQTNNGIYFLIGGIIVVGGGTGFFLMKKSKKK
jgi:LPXTG-motif cell wall-anchored protein